MSIASVPPILLTHYLMSWVKTLTVDSRIYRFLAMNYSISFTVFIYSEVKSNLAQQH